MKESSGTAYLFRNCIAHSSLNDASRDDPREVLVSQGQPEAHYAPEPLEYGQTYYWRVDEVNAHSIAATDMWLAVPGAEPLQIQYEFDRLYKLHEMWVWNASSEFEAILGAGLKNVTIEYSANGGDWQSLRDFEFAQGTAMPGYRHNTTVDLGGVLAQYVRLTANSY